MPKESTTVPGILTVLFALFALFALSATVFGTEQESAPSVQARVVYGVAAGERQEEKPQKDATEPWVRKALRRAGSPGAVPKTKWIELTAETKRLLTANGFYIEAKVVNRKGVYRVEIEGCDGFSLDQQATLKPGERKVIQLTDHPAPENTFVALKISKPRHAK